MNEHLNRQSGILKWVHRQMQSWLVSTGQPSVAFHPQSLFAFLHVFCIIVCFYNSQSCEISQKHWQALTPVELGDLRLGSHRPASNLFCLFSSLSEIFLISISLQIFIWSIFSKISRFFVIPVLGLVGWFDGSGG